MAKRRDGVALDRRREQAPASSPIADMLASLMAKAVLAGIAAMVIKRVR